MSLAPGGTAFVDVGAVSGFEASDVSTTIESDRLVVVDRMMEWGIDPATGHGYGSSLETATASPSTTWFLAEGSTVLGFDLYYLLQNPQSTIANVTVRYLLSSGTVITRTYSMAPHSRTTIYVNVIPGIEETDVSGDITADRADHRRAGDVSQHAGTVLRARHGLHGGHRAGHALVPRRGRHRHLLRSLRPVRQPQRHRRATSRPSTPRKMGRSSRGTTSSAPTAVSASTSTASPDSTHTSVATTVTSTNNVPIVVERAMYWPDGFFNYYEGHTSVGTTGTAQRWVIASGDGDPATQTFVLLANTENRPGQAELRIMSPSGFNASLQRVVNLPPNSRTTVESRPACRRATVSS